MFRLRTCFALLSMWLSVGQAFAAWGDARISRMAGPWPITITTCAHDAGAICSLSWRNKEFIDDADHGRQLQSASFFDELDGGFNPTEAGASQLYDGVNPSPSSSLLQGLSTNGNVLRTQTRMAFWFPVDGSLVSRHVLNKRVEIGAAVSAHVIKYETQFSLPDDEVHSSVAFEAVTAYMPPEFSEFHTYEPRLDRLAPLSDGPGEQDLPIIFSTPDGGWAMGIYAVGNPAATTAPSYGRWRFSDVVKWNAVSRIVDPKGSYHFTSYLIVGSLGNVKTAMRQLVASL